MRKLFFVIAALFCGIISVFAQDVIVLKNGNEINAIVLEVGIDNVKYKRFDNPNGPNYTLLQSAILMITYENGTQDVFEQKIKMETSLSPELEQIRKEFYVIGKNDDKMLEFLNTHDTKFYDDFKLACKQGQKGGSLLACGVATSIGGIILGVIGGVKQSPLMYSAGIVVGVVGEGVIIGGIVKSASAGGKKNVIKNGFSEKYFGEKTYSYRPSLNFGLTTNGIGFIIDF